MDGVDGEMETTGMPDETPNGADRVAEDNAAQNQDGESSKLKGEVMDVEVPKDNTAKVEETNTAAVNGTNVVEEELQQETRDWADLSMLEKLESIHMVMEWHFQNPLRLRGIMRSDDDAASWVSNSTELCSFS